MGIPFGEILAKFKKTETPEVLVSLIEDQVLRRSLVAWQSVIIKYKTPIEDCPEEISEVEKWYWLWNRIDFNQEKFAMVAALRGQDVEPVLTRLQGLKLIYPDGSINSIAQQYLRSVVAAQLKKAAPKGNHSSKQAQPSST